MHTKPIFREAERADLPKLVAMLADDALGARREQATDPLPESYLKAFDAIERDPNNELWVVTVDDDIAAMLQLTFIPCLTYRGGWRALVEGVRVKQDQRGRGIGEKVFDHAIERARRRQCHLVQLTTDKSRPDALRFYERLGFSASHEGMKLHLQTSQAAPFTCPP